jgi:hypothetical protein
MSDRADRMRELRRQAVWERDDLGLALAELRAEAEDRRARWALAGKAATWAAAGITAAWKLFGRNSLAARTSRIASTAGLLIGLARGARRLRRLW